MATVYRGNKSYFLDEKTNTLWGSSDMKQQFDNDTGEPIEKSYSTSSIEPIIQDNSTENTVENIVADDPLKCHCGYVAKSNAGLAVHKLRHKVE